MATTEGKKRASVWGRSAPALPFGQSACGGHGLRSTPPNAAGPGAAPGLLTRNTAPATLSLQAGPVRLHYYILNCPGDCRKMGVSSYFAARRTIERSIVEGVRNEPDYGGDYTFPGRVN